MPKISGNDIISKITERQIKYSLIFSGATILSKLYNISFENFNIFGVNIPASLIDTSLFILLIVFTYSLLVNWIGDILGFRFWYNSNSITSSPWGTEMKLDKSFTRGGLSLLDKLYNLEKTSNWPDNFEELDENIKKEYTGFKTNIELYIARLEGAGTKFNTLSLYVKFYIFIQSLVIPLFLNSVSIYLLFTYGKILSPLINLITAAPFLFQRKGFRLGFVKIGGGI